MNNIHTTYIISPERYKESVNTEELLDAVSKLLKCNRSELLQKFYKKLKLRDELEEKCKKLGIDTLT